MIKMLVLSDIIKSRELEWKKSMALPNIDVYSWAEDAPRVSDYEIVVLDMKVQSNSVKNHFIGIQNEIHKLLIAGNVVVCFTFDIMFNSNKITSYTGASRYENNYDWLSDDNKLALGLIENKGIGTNIKILTKNDLLIDYFKNVNNYRKTVHGDFRMNESENVIFIKMDYNSFEETYNWNKVDVLAISKPTDEPIACIIHIGKGKLVFLPQSNLLQDKNGLASSVVQLIYNFGKELYEENLEKFGGQIEQPEWVKNYKSEEENNIEKGIEKKETELAALRKDHKRFRIVDALLYGTGDEVLRKAVKKVFEEWGCEVETTSPAANMDLKANETTQKMKFIIEVTGISDKVNKANKKFAKILQHIPNREDDEQIILAVNTFRDKDPKDRSEDFTADAIKLAVGNEFCLITTVDLFNLWKDFLKGRKAVEILEGIYRCKGKYNYISL